MEKEQPKRLGNPALYKPWFKVIVFAASMAIFAVAGIQGFATNSPESYTVVNSFFAILLALAAVCFSFSRTAAAETVADRVTFAGERLLHGAILVVTTTVLRYAAFKLTGNAASVSEMHIAIAIPVGLLLAFCGAIFISGLVFASTGIRVLSDVLIDRMFRHDDWDDIA